MYEAGTHAKKSKSKKRVGYGFEAMLYEVKPLAEEWKHVEEKEARQGGDIMLGVLIGVAEAENENESGDDNEEYQVQRRSVLSELRECNQKSDGIHAF